MPWSVVFTSPNIRTISKQTNRFGVLPIVTKSAYFAAFGRSYRYCFHVHIQPHILDKLFHGRSSQLRLRDCG